MVHCLFLMMILSVCSLVGMEERTIVATGTLERNEKNKASLSVKTAEGKLLEIGVATYGKYCEHGTRMYGVIKSLQIHTSYQGKGYGTMLLDAVVKDVRETFVGNTPIYITLNSQKYTAAARFLTRAGFKNSDKHPELFILDGTLIQHPPAVLSHLKVITQKYSLAAL